MADRFPTGTGLRSPTDQLKLITISETKNQIIEEESAGVRTVNDSTGDSRVLVGANAFWSSTRQAPFEIPSWNIPINHHILWVWKINNLRFALHVAKYSQMPLLAWLTAYPLNRIFRLAYLWRSIQWFLGVQKMARTSHQKRSQRSW